MKEISEINKKINLGGGGGQQTPSLPPPRGPTMPALRPGMTATTSGGLSMVNMLAPHLQPGWKGGGGGGGGG